MKSENEPKNIPERGNLLRTHVRIHEHLHLGEPCIGEYGNEAETEKGVKILCCRCGKPVIEDTHANKKS